MDYFPVFMNVRDRRCLVVGGGEVALRKASLLRRAGARVHFVAERASPALCAWVDAGHATLDARRFDDADVDGAFLVFAATGDREVNARISAAADERAVPVNVADDPALCTFIMPALVDRAPVLVAVSSSGAVPVLARMVRGTIEAALPARLGELASLCAALRDEVKERLADLGARRRFWESALEGQGVALALAGDRAGAEASLRRTLDEHAMDAGVSRGFVDLVGAGPDDPDLVSFRALRCMQRAEIVVPLHGVSSRIVELCRRDAERWPAPEAPDGATAHLARVITAAQSGKRLCVLAYGDAFRSEEARVWSGALRAASVSYSIVPGIEPEPR